MTALRSLALTTAYSAVIYLAILLFRKLFAGRMSAAMQYGVWFLLVLRLLLPFTIDSGFSFITLHGPVAQFIESARSGDVPSSAGNGAHWVRALAVPALAAWAAGMAACFIWFLAQYMRLRRRLSRYGKPSDAATRSVFARVKAELGVKRGPKLLYIGNISTPALTVGLTPRLLLPSGANGSARSEEELANVFRHELTHYKRGDHIVCLLLTALRCVYWFNPVVWLASRQMQLDMEISCDNLAVRNMDAAGKKRYAAMMLSMFGRPGRPGFVLGMGLESNRKSIEKRIRGVFMKTKSKNAALFAAAASALLLILACFTTACVPSVDHAQASPSPSVSSTAVALATQSAPPQVAASPLPAQSSAPSTATIIYPISGSDEKKAILIIRNYWRGSHITGDEEPSGEYIQIYPAP
jgi:beta-lactamase regulating signal transducer with metallopeptidase domain